MNKTVFLCSQTTKTNNFNFACICLENEKSNRCLILTLSLHIPHPNRTKPQTNNISSSNEFCLKWLGTRIQSNLYFSRENSRVYFRLYTFAIYFRMHEIWRTANVLIKYAARLYRSSVCPSGQAADNPRSQGAFRCFAFRLIDTLGKRIFQ